MTDTTSHRPSRRGLRLRDYDYAQAGAYFVTVCTDRRRCLFGRIRDDVMRRNAIGDAVFDRWHALPQHYAGIELDAFVIMPNHVHGILLLGQDDRTDVHQYGLSEVIRGFKSFSARHINRLRRRPGVPVWQRSYHDHIIRSDAKLQKIRRYIEENPLRWALDRENPANVRSTGGSETRPYTVSKDAVGAGLRPTRKRPQS